MWWTKKPTSEKSRREQLIEAREALTRQIGILQSGNLYSRELPGVCSERDRAQIETLSQELEQIENALEELGPPS